MAKTLSASVLSMPCTFMENGSNINSSIESGYYRFKDGHVESFKNLDIQERTTYRGFADAEKYIVIGVQEHCSIISENDQWIEQLQEHETLSPEIMRDLQKNISKNKTYNVRLGI